MSKVGEIKNLIKNSDLTFSAIASKFNVHVNTIYNINKGHSHYDELERYPLRTNEQTIARSLRSKLSIPRGDIIKEPSVASPQLLDYISLLSLLDISSDSIILFKKVFIKELEEISNKKWSDEDLKGLIKTQPRYPKTLKMLVDAYYEPVFKFLNQKHWLSIGFLSEKEASAIYLLFN